MMKTKTKRTLSLLAVALLLAFGLTACTGTKEDDGPSLTPDELANVIKLDGATFYTADDGEITIPATAVPLAANSTTFGLTPDTVWSASTGSSQDFTLPADAALADGSLGVLSIPAIGLTVNVYEAQAGEELEAMTHGVAHMPITSCWDGNVGIAGHNSGVNTYFRQLYRLTAGDSITYKTVQGTRTYRVESSTAIDEYDWSNLGRTEDNRITLITCIDNQPAQRLCVQGVELTE